MTLTEARKVLKLMADNSSSVSGSLPYEMIDKILQMVEGNPTEEETTIDLQGNTDTSSENPPIYTWGDYIRDVAESLGTSSEEPLYNTKPITTETDTADLVEEP